MQTIRLLSSVAAVAFITGCAHPIMISPDISKIERSSDAQPIRKNVGYYISPEIREKEVTTPGGGGDKVSYRPYKDIEMAYYKMLGNVFQSATLLPAPNDMDTIGKREISYIFTLDITTDSSSPSPFTWPPTKFTVNLTSNINDAAGTPVTLISVTGEGQAEFDEFKSDLSLSGKRAAQDAILQTQDKLLGTSKLRN